MPQVPFSQLTGLSTFQELPYEEQAAVAKKYWQRSAAEEPQEPQAASTLKLEPDQQPPPSYHDQQYNDSLRLLNAKEKMKSATPLQARFLQQELADSSTAMVVRQSIKSGRMTQEEGVAFANDQTEKYRPQVEEAEFFIKDFKNRENARQDLAQSLQKAGLFGSATSAMGGSPDKDIRRGVEGNWDLPLISPTGRGAVVDTLQGVTVGIGQKTGARLDDAGPAVDKQAIQNLFHNFQQKNNLSDEEVASAWKDLGNINRKMEVAETGRVLSDGSILPNYANSDWLDTDKASVIIDQLPAPAIAKEMAKYRLPEIQRKISDSKLEAYAAASAGTPLQGPVEWAMENNRLEDFGTPKFTSDYEEKVASKSGWGQGMIADLQQGNMKLLSTLAGLGGALGSDASGELGATASEASRLVGAGSKDTGLVGSLIEELPSLIAQIGITRGLGAGVTALGASEAAALRVGTVGALTTAGAQSAGATYSDAIAQGVPKEIAREKATRAGLNTALITGLFQDIPGLGGVEKIAAGRAVGEITMREVFKSASKKELAKNFGRMTGALTGAGVGEGLEEGSDQLTAAFLNADPDTNLSEAWSDAVKATQVGAFIGTTVTGFTKTLEKPTFTQTDDELESDANALAIRNATQENLPPAEDAGGTIAPPSDTSVAPKMSREDFTTAVAEEKTRLEAIEEPTEAEQGMLEILQGTEEEIAEQFDVEITEEAQNEQDQTIPEKIQVPLPPVSTGAEAQPDLVAPSSDQEAATPTQAEAEGEVAAVIPEDRGAPQARVVVSNFLTPEAKALPAENFQQQKIASPEQVTLQNSVAKMYDELPEDDSSNPEVVQAYENLTTEVLEQHKAMLGSGLKIELVSESPYKSSKEMVEDVKRGQLKVQRTDSQTYGTSPDVFNASKHPMLRDSGLKDVNGQSLLVNDIFRGVHDYVAHAAFGSTFGPLGEEAAWKAHLATIKDPLARRALTTETRGQNSWVNYRDEMLRNGSPIKRGESGYIAPQDRPFATQKFALLPEEALQEINEQQKPQSQVPKTREEKLTAFSDKLQEIFHMKLESTAPAAPTVEPTGQMTLFQDQQKGNALLSEQAYNSIALSELSSSLKGVQVTVTQTVVETGAKATYTIPASEIKKMKTAKSGYEALLECIS